MTVNIMGDTPKEQWLNAIMIYEECIYENIRLVRDDIEADWCNSQAPGDVERLDIAMRTTKNFAAEMRRLVEGACR